MQFKNMKITSIYAIPAIFLLLAACAQTSFQEYEGRNGPKMVEGEGGTKETIEGYELWGSGTPPRRYQVLGMTVIEDFDNVFGNQRIRSALVSQIKAVGADAAIAIDASGGGQMVGAAFSSRGAITPAVGFGKKSNRYEIIKYLDKSPR